MNAIASNYQIILLDVEGTTTSISFVTDVLFPYARDNVQTFLENHWDSEETQQDVQLFVQEMTSQGVELTENPSSRSFIPKLALYIQRQIADNKKTTPLKQLQGHIWRTGYGSGVLKGHMYDDVKPCLESWTRRGYKVFIYSSGSVEAQKLIFGCSIVGNLLTYITGHFDTTIGSKTEAGSYSKIASALQCPAEKIVFLTDNLVEATAANASGMGVLLSVRHGTTPLPSNVCFPIIYSFVDARL